MATGQYSRRTLGAFTDKPSSIASDHGSALSVVMICCRRSYYKEQWMVSVKQEDCVNYEKNNIKELTGQSMSSLLRICRWAVFTARASVGVLQRRLAVTDIS